MKRGRFSLIGFVAIWLSVGCLALPCLAKKKKVRPSNSPPTEATLSFAQSEGWGVPVITRASNGRAIQLWFHKAPSDMVAELAKRLGTEERKVFTRVEAVQVPGQAVVQLHTRRRIGDFERKKARRGRGIRIMVRLENPSLIPGVSYVDMIPNLAARSALSSVEYSMARGRKVDCSLLEPYASYAEPWAGWIVIKYADCLYQEGRQSDAAAVMMRLARKRNTPRPIVILAALRLDEWPDTWNPWIRLVMSNKMMASLPVPILQELHLRQSRRMMRQGRASRARRGFLRALKWDVLPVGMEWVAHDLRLELMEAAFAKDEKIELLRLYQDFPVPPPIHPAYLSTLRLAAICYAQLGYSKQALALASIVLHPLGGVVDPMLTNAMVNVVQMAGKAGEYKDIMGSSPTDERWFENMVNEAEVSPSTSLMLASWLLDSWDSAGVRAVSQVATEGSPDDPTQALSEARLAVMVSAKECEAIQNAAPGSLPADKAAFASLCHMGEKAPMAAMDIWGSREDPLGTEDVFTEAVRQHATNSAIFFETFSEWEE